jgi:predicted transcriptional regulator
MFLFELDGADPLSTKLIVLTNQLKADIESGKIDPSSYTTDEFLQYLQASGDIVLDVTDLYDMIKNPPLNTVISNIQGDKVVFKGHDDTQAPPDETQSQQVVGQMAQNAMPTQ